MYRSTQGYSTIENCPRSPEDLYVNSLAAVCDDHATANTAIAIDGTDFLGTNKEVTPWITNGNIEYPIKQVQLYKSKFLPSVSWPAMLLKTNQMRAEPTAVHPKI